MLTDTLVPDGRGRPGGTRRVPGRGGIVIPLRGQLLVPAGVLALLPIACPPALDSQASLSQQQNRL